jgi:ABC-type oligopeptide transport system ATPase subunit
MQEMKPCTQDQRAAIVRAAEQRAHYILWIADKLTLTDDALIRKEAAKLLRELVGK